MGRPLLSLAFLACLLPFAAANVELSGPFVVQGWYQYSPQVHCTIVVTESGSDECHATGEASRLTHLRARLVGTASVFAIVDKLNPDGTKTQLARIDCTGAQRSCLVPLAFGKELPVGTYEIHAYVTAAAGAVVSVDLEQSGPLVLP